MALDHSNVYVHNVPAHQVEGNGQMFNIDNSYCNVKRKDVNSCHDRSEHNVIDNVNLIHI